MASFSNSIIKKFLSFSCLSGIKKFSIYSYPISFLISKISMEYQLGLWILNKVEEGKVLKFRLNVIREGEMLSSGIRYYVDYEVATKNNNRIKVMRTGI